MKKAVYFIPVILALLFYGWVIAYQQSLLGLSAQEPICIALLFIAAVLMKDGKWWGCAFGLIAMRLEMGAFLDSPAAYLLFLFYVICGAVLYRNTKPNSEKKEIV